MSEPSNNAESANSAGDRLKLAREQAGLSVEKVAKDLYLDTRVIQAIEINHFSELGAPVYAKGYLRKYARLVGLSEEDVLTQYQKSPDATPLPVIIPAALGSISSARQPLPRWVRWLVLAIIVVAGVTTLMNLRSSNNDSVVQGALITRPLPKAEVSEPPSSDAAAVAEPQAIVAAANSIPANALTLRFNFSGDSWVEVYDAQNQSLLHETGAANSTREVAGVPPLRVVLGAASKVSLSVNARNIEIPASAKQADVAKFTIKADGSLE